MHMSIKSEHLKITPMLEILEMKFQKYTKYDEQNLLFGSDGKIGWPRPGSFGRNNLGDAGENVL